MRGPKAIPLEILSGSVAIVEVSQDVLEAFFELQDMRAKMSDGRLDAFSDDQQYRSLLTDLAAQNGLQACAVHANQRTIGVMLFSVDEIGGVLHIINQGFDPKYAEHGVGFVMQQEIIRYAHAQHIRSVDYLKGDEPYKRWFTNRMLKVYKYAEPLSSLGKRVWSDVKGYVADYVE